MKKNSAKTLARRSGCEARLREFSALSEDELFRRLKAGPDGLTAPMAEEKLDEFGLNAITSGRVHGPFYRLLQAIANPFNLVLLLIAVITLFTDVVFSVQKDFTTAVIILGLVSLSTGISFFQGERSNSAAARLSKMISNQADVLRDGKSVSLPISELVPGDIVLLSAGDIIPGDVRFLGAKDAFIAQAALTGESNPVEKFAGEPRGGEEAITDLSNVGFMGSNMVSGSARAVILATGNNTYFGSMAQSLTGDRAKNSFERGVDSVSHLLIRFMLVMVPVIFLVNGITKGDWMNSFLFAISVAVGLTPEMLPMIMSSTLAKGAVSMAKHQTIVKTLSAIQTFGEMDVLCTDKTGTLTEDRIVLERYMDLHGNDNSRILRHAYLNSYFQTGLKNLIDVAIINRAGENGLEVLQEHYTRVDEIPFDFTRRRMSVILKDGTGKRQLITKGAVEEMFSACAWAEFDGKVVPLTEELRQEAMAVYEEQNRGGLRMIGVAQRNELPDRDNFSAADEHDMVLIGFIGFLDPPKESAATAITALNDHGVQVAVLTGDSEGVALKVCKKVGVDVSRCLTGRDVEGMDDGALGKAVETCRLFSKLSPAQKERVVAAFQKNGHTVGYMGDGINDAPAMHQADVGISVDSAVDIAKETADIILLKKDLMVLEQGVVEGRRTFGNIMKYIKMAASGNFGNMISIMAASIFLPFLPLLPVHILTQNLLCDFAQVGIPFDKMDPGYIKSTHKWDTKSIQRFMVVMGPLSSLFDIALYCVMWWVMGASNMANATLFQCGCFIFGTLSQILVVHMIRTEKVPFIQSRSSRPLALSTGLVSVVTLAIGFTGLAHMLDLTVMPTVFLPWLVLLCFGYCVASQIVKRFYIKRWGEWI